MVLFIVLLEDTTSDVTMDICTWTEDGMVGRQLQMMVITKPDKAQARRRPGNMDGTMTGVDRRQVDSG